MRFVFAFLGFFGVSMAVRVKGFRPCRVEGCRPYRLRVIGRIVSKAIRSERLFAPGVFCGSGCGFRRAAPTSLRP